MKRQTITTVLALAILIGLVPIATSRAQDAEVTVTFAAYAVARETYGDQIAQFQSEWQDKTGQKVVFKESYQASGALSRAIAGGLDVDITALQLDTEINRIVDAKLITHDWKKNLNNGYISTSVVVVAVRPDNPKQIKDWIDLTKPGIEVLVPDPSTSGGARWNVLGAYGAAKRGKIDGYKATDDDALKFLGSVIKNVSVMAKDGRENILNFERGVGDVAISYENEITTGQAAGGQYEMVYPSSTILIQQPIALIDVNVDKHNNRKIVEAFLDFLWSPKGQRIFAKHGYRPVDPKVASEEDIAKQFPKLKDTFTIEDFGGWDRATKDLFSDKGTITTLITDIKGKS